ncbi:sensor histidine kinase [Rhizobium sp. CG4]|jgi:two-component system C4-dicarboxylate transport sensor histidine kinase DctB|uniref:ATP-binding protein n=1 Tax=unclassified Rhizobium TaxID=2613769 RepID=UPI002033BB53|nr:MULTISPECIES: ATP-binding protein [unclassified Rhizobium]MCM2457755.1 sensor histidine kinase [Rhizobium sp. CG4]MCS4243222.1 two-component system C4-dicarboxylate transport sensor histidine kinase DctB [Rhizobium sp. BIGb0125]
MTIFTASRFKHIDAAQRPWWLFAFIWAVIVVVAIYVAGELGRTETIKALQQDASTDGQLKVALLNVALERPRALPLVLSGDRDLVAALETGGAAVDRLNRKLEGLIEGTQASVIYVTGPNGVAIASSNWRAADSFVGTSYSFRDYFSLAMRTGMAEHYALGNVSRKPGLYISRRVDSEDGKALGVVIAKVEFNRLEADWRIGGKPVYVADANGVVLMTSISAWRFDTIKPIDQQTRRTIADSLQFGNETLDLLPFSSLRFIDNSTELIHINSPAVNSGDYLRFILPVPTTSWHLHYLLPVEPTLMVEVQRMRLLMLAGMMPLIVLSGLWLRRRQKARQAEEVAAKARAELERRVDERTRDLQSAMDQLETEISGHQQTGRELQTVQQELVKANRLAILGQVAAGVAHEINQPVATIRAFADNARTLMNRQRLEEADENMKDIAALTERIGVITSDLKILARKGRAAAQPVRVKAVIEGAVVLLRSRFAGHMEALNIALPAETLMVSGSPIRLEQIVINLLQNALEAVEDKAGGQVTISVREAADQVVLSVADNGPGIAPDILEALFTPFNTSKDGGLGLGLVISREIAADYGGRIEVESNPSGTCFSVYLKKA